MTEISGFQYQIHCTTHFFLPIKRNQETSFLIIPDSLQRYLRIIARISICKNGFPVTDVPCRCLPNGQTGKEPVAHLSQTDTTVDEMTNHVKKKKQGVEIHRGKRHIRSLQFLKTVAILVQISTCQPLEAFIGQGIGKSTRKAVYLNDHPVPMKWRCLELSFSSPVGFPYFLST